MRLLRLHSSSMTTLRATQRRNARGSAGSSLAGVLHAPRSRRRPSPCAATMPLGGFGFFGSSVLRHANAAAPPPSRASSVSIFACRRRRRHRLPRPRRSSARTCSFPGSIAAAFSRGSERGAAFASASADYSTPCLRRRASGERSGRGDTAPAIERSATAGVVGRAAAGSTAASTLRVARARALTRRRRSPQRGRVRCPSAAASRPRRRRRTAATRPPPSQRLLRCDAPGTCAASTTSASFLEAESQKSRSAEAAAPPSSRPSAAGGRSAARTPQPREESATSALRRRPPR